MKFGTLRMAVCLVAVSAALLLLLWPASAHAGLVRSCPITVVTSTDPNCTPEVPRNDTAAIFDSYAITAAKTNAEVEDRAAIKVVHDALQSEHYAVKEREGPGGYVRPQLADFVGLAKRASVLYISAHGVVPGVSGRECVAARSLYFQEEDRHQAPPMPDLRRLSCSFEGGLAIQPEPTETDLIGAWSAYVEEGYNLIGSIRSSRSRPVARRRSS